MVHIIYINLTQHNLTEEQKKQNAFELEPEVKEKYLKLLNFESIPEVEDMQERAKLFMDNLLLIENQSSLLCQIIKLSEDLGGHIDVRPILGSSIPAMNYYLIDEAKKHSIMPVYSFSKRIVEESYDNNNNCVIKTSRFVHEGFYQAY